MLPKSECLSSRKPVTSAAKDEDEEEPDALLTGQKTGTGIVRVGVVVPQAVNRITV